LKPLFSASPYIYVNKQTNPPLISLLKKSPKKSFSIQNNKKSFFIQNTNKKKIIIDSLSRRTYENKLKTAYEQNSHKFYVRSNKLIPTDPDKLFF